MKKIIILKGLPASGKSTWAKEQVKKYPGQYKRINKDDLRAMLDGGHYSKGNEKFIVTVRDLLIMAALNAGKHVIVDDTNLNPIHESRIRNIVFPDTVIEVKFFEVDVDEAIRRDAKREASVGRDVILKMYNEFLKPEAPVIEYDKSLEDAVIVDVDGTLAHMVDRGPYDWKRVGEDKLCQEVSELVEHYKWDAYKIIVVTGRDGSCEQETRQWLDKHHVPYDELYIRPAGNNEQDAIIKRRIYDEHIKGKYNVRVVIDDRDQVVRMWRSLGLKCIQVADGTF